MRHSSPCQGPLSYFIVEGWEWPCRLSWPARHQNHPEGMDSGIPKGWLLLIGIPPLGRIFGSSILVVPLVTSKIIGLAGEIQNKRDWSRTPTGFQALFIKRSERFPTRGTNTLGPIQTRDRELARKRPFLGLLLSYRWRKIFWCKKDRDVTHHRHSKFRT